MSDTKKEELHKRVTDFRDKLLEDALEADEELAAKRDLEEMAAFMVRSHVKLRDSVGATDLTATGKSYVRLDAAEEFALELYWASEWAAKPPAWFATWISAHPIYRAAFDILRYVLGKYEHEKMSQAEYDKLVQLAKQAGLVGNDGTIYGFAKYEQLDRGWMISALNFILNVVHPGDIHAFGDPDVSVATMHAHDPSKDPVLGILGDWGGGRYEEEGTKGNVPSPAVRVLNDLNRHSIDYLFHLGDTYYAGTDGTSRLGPDSANEEQDNLVDLWPDQGEGRNYTLNSNHEMYGAAQGYFGTALKQSGLFDHQHGASFFALEYPLDPEAGKGKSWLVLGLDSAYYSDKENGVKMYMEGAIGSKKFLDEHRKQMKAIARLADGHDGPVMVMTHHNPCDTITTETNVLYDQVSEVLGRAPTLWIWGHVHNCIVYDQMIVGAKNKGTVSPTKSRCCGHGAVPFGPAWGLEDASLPYYAHTHDDAFPATDPRVYNGYGLVTLHSDGGFTERYYEVREPGRSGVEAWSRHWKGSELPMG